MFDIAESWHTFVDAMRGSSDLAPTISNIRHPAQALLQQLRDEGAPVQLSTAPWSHQQKVQAIQRGSHPSTIAHAEFLRNEMANMVEQKFWIVLDFQRIQHMPGLRLSPMGVVPQRDRRPRPIVDYTYSGINHNTISPAPKDAMQFGRAFERVLHRIHHANPTYGPVYLIKVDLADGFYRVPLLASTLLSLAVAFPHLPSEPPLVAIPLVLPMGWVASPPYFCAVTETITDLANHTLRRRQKSPPHRLTYIADHPNNYTPIPTSSTSAVQHHPTPTPVPLHRKALSLSLIRRPLAYIDIYMDDFIALSQGHPAMQHHVRNTLFNSIDLILQPLQPDDVQFNRTEPISIKKLNKGDAFWSTRKTILGWVVDTYQQTIELPPHRAERLLEILELLLQKRRISFKKWQQYIGELQSMLLALPGGRGLFSTLYTGYADGFQSNRLSITRPVKDALLDLYDLAHDLQARPTRLGEIVDTIPVAYGTADASAKGMGGVWLSADPKFPPILWRMTFPPKVQTALVSTANPNGTITNSDLELAGQIAAQDLLLNHYDCRERSLSVFTDNVSARAWQRKGLCTTLGAAAYLLRLLSLHQRHFRYRATFDYLPGPLNVMADDASRCWDLSDDALLTHFNLSYPQTKPWNILPLRPDINSALISALFCKRCAPVSFLPVLNPATLPGFDGKPIVQHWESLRFAPKSAIHFLSSKSLPTATALEKLHPVATLSNLVPWKGPSAPLARRWPFWGPTTPDSTHTVNQNLHFNNNFADTTDLIPLPLESNRSQFL